MSDHKFYYSPLTGVFMLDKKEYLHNAIYVVKGGFSYEAYLDEVQIRASLVCPTEDFNFVDIVPGHFYLCSVDSAGYVSVEV